MKRSKYDNELKGIGETSCTGNSAIIRPGIGGSGSFATDIPLAISRIRIFCGESICTVKWKARTEENFPDMPPNSDNFQFLDGYKPKDSEYTN